MTKQTYLFKNRHGVYYFRAVLPLAVRTRLGLKQREIRRSLRTRDRQQAKYLLAAQVFRMSQELFPWEVAADYEKQKFELGLKLIGQYPDFNINDRFSLDSLREILTNDDLEAYIFATEHREGKNVTLSKDGGIIFNQLTCH